MAASGVDHLAKKWCVLKPSANLNGDEVAPSVGYACQNADCTSLGYGTSCGNLDVHGNISYAFNSYYQINDQMDTACKFPGLSMVTDKDPSVGSCRFRIMIQTDSAVGLNGIVIGSPRTVFVVFVFLILCNLSF